MDTTRVSAAVGFGGATFGNGRTFLPRCVRLQEVKHTEVHVHLKLLAHSQSQEVCVAGDETKAKWRPHEK